jgi:acyl dehydratase
VTATATARLHADVRAGDELPTLTHAVTSTTVVLGALATRDWRPQHHDFHFATERNGVRDIFLSAPNQAAWLERFVTDWSGPRGRLGRMTFRMRDSVFPGDTMTLTGTVSRVWVDDHQCGWAAVDVTVRADERVCTTGTVQVALPVAADDNPWARAGERWQP